MSGGTTIVVGGRKAPWGWIAAGGAVLAVAITAAVWYATRQRRSGAKRGCPACLGG